MPFSSSYSKNSKHQRSLSLFKSFTDSSSSTNPVGYGKKNHNSHKSTLVQTNLERQLWSQAMASSSHGTNFSKSPTSSSTSSASSEFSLTSNHSSNSSTSATTTTTHQKSYSSAKSPPLIGLGVELDLESEAFNGPPADQEEATNSSKIKGGRKSHQRTPSTWELETTQQLDQIKASYSTSNEVLPNTVNIISTNNGNISSSNSGNFKVNPKRISMTSIIDINIANSADPYSTAPTMSMNSHIRSSSVASDESTDDHPLSHMAPTPSSSSSSFFASPNLSRSSSTSTTNRNSLIRSKHTSTASTISTLRHFSIINIEAKNTQFPSTSNISSDNEQYDVSMASIESNEDSKDDFSNNVHHPEQHTYESTESSFSTISSSQSSSFSTDSHYNNKTRYGNLENPSNGSGKVINQTIMTTKNLLDSTLSSTDATPTASIFSPHDHAKINNLSNSSTILSFKRDKLKYKKKISKDAISLPTGLVDCEAHFTHSPEDSIHEEDIYASPARSGIPRQSSRDLLSSSSPSSRKGTLSSSHSIQSINSIASPTSSVATSEKSKFMKHRTFSISLSSSNSSLSSNSGASPRKTSSGSTNHRMRHSVIASISNSNLFKSFKKDSSSNSLNSIVGSPTMSNFPQNECPSLYVSEADNTTLKNKKKDEFLSRHDTAFDSQSSPLKSLNHSNFSSSSLSVPTRVVPRQGGPKKSISEMRKSFLSLSSSTSLFRSSSSVNNSQSGNSHGSSNNSGSNLSANSNHTVSTRKSFLGINSFSFPGGGSSESNMEKPMISLPTPVEASREKLKNKLRASSSLLSLTRSEDGSGDPLAIPAHEHHLSQMEKLLSLSTSKTIQEFETYLQKLLSLGGSFKKLNEATYSEVFIQDIPTSNKAKSGFESRIYKIIPFGNEELGQSPIQDLIQELQISKLVMNLEGFVDVLDVAIVKGFYPKFLLNEWDKYSAAHGTENHRPDVYNNQQMYCIIVQSNAGTDLERYKIESWTDAECIFWQAVSILAQAEERYQFEHRDLHWGNIVISDQVKHEVTTEDMLSKLALQDIPDSHSNTNSAFMNNNNVWLNLISESRNFLLARSTLKVTLIDYTLSRASNPDGGIIHTRMDSPEFFRGKGDYQFDIYRYMRKHISAYNEALSAAAHAITCTDASSVDDDNLAGERFASSKSKYHVYSKNPNSGLRKDSATSVTSLNSPAVSTISAFSTGSSNSVNNSGVEWAAFCPRTNVLWLHYLVDKLLNQKGLQPISVTRSGRVVNKNNILNDILSHQSVEDEARSISDYTMNSHGSRRSVFEGDLLAEEARACKSLESIHRALDPKRKNNKAPNVGSSSQSKRQYKNSVNTSANLSNPSLLASSSASMMSNNSSSSNQHHNGIALGTPIMTHSFATSASSTNQTANLSLNPSASNVSTATTNNSNSQAMAVVANANIQDFNNAGDVLKWGYRSKLFPGHSILSKIDT